MILVPIESAYATSYLSPLGQRSYTAPFLRYGDLLAKNCLFFLPLSHSAPSLPMFTLEFRAEVNRQETGVMGLSSSEDRILVAGVVLYHTIPYHVRLIKNLTKCKLGHNNSN